MSAIVAKDTAGYTYHDADADDDRPALEPLVASLLARAPRMNFMQLCRILERRAPGLAELGACDSAEHEPVRFRPRARVGFPAGEIASVEFDDVEANTRPTVRTTFMGLYGVDAAMPSHLIDDIVLRVEGHEAVEHFLDQFNHRFVTLLYRAWKKYRYPVSFAPGGVDAHSRRLLCLAGFGWGDKPARAGLPDSRLLALLGLLVQRTRTPEGLAGVIALAAPGVGVRVDEFWPTWRASGRQRPLGAARASAATNAADIVVGGDGDDSAPHGLGGGYVLGARLAYRSRAVRVVLTPADASQARSLLPGAALHRELVAFLRLYVGTKADVFLFMRMSSRLVPLPRIGPPQDDAVPRLAWTTVLPATQDRLITIALGRYEAFPAPAVNPYVDARRVA
ncbi:MAG TPA: type VI secretion system baseplate subunit TssG [Paraburkholderia sp.]|jgi:type VI secretion system protein ImpH